MLCPNSTLRQTSRRLKRGMFDKARDIHFALVLSCLGKIIRGLHPQPHVGTAAESPFKAERHLGRDGTSTSHHVVKLLARDLYRFRRLRAGQQGQRKTVRSTLYEHEDGCIGGCRCVSVAPSSEDSPQDNAPRRDICGRIKFHVN